MTKANTSNVPSDQSESSPHRVRLPGFITDEEIGLGDVIKRTTSYFGFNPVGVVSVERLRLIGGWFLPADSRARGIARTRIPD